MPSSAKLKLATNKLGLLTQPASARAGSLGELQLRTYWCGRGVGVQKFKLYFLMARSQLPTSYLPAELAKAL